MRLWFDISKIAEIHARDKLTSYKKAPISAQILSAIKSNEQLLTDSHVMDRIMSTSIILLDQNSNANDVDGGYSNRRIFKPSKTLGLFKASKEFHSSDYFQVII